MFLYLKVVAKPIGSMDRRIRMDSVHLIQTNFFTGREDGQENT